MVRCAGVRTWPVRNTWVRSLRTCSSADASAGSLASRAFTISSSSGYRTSRLQASARPAVAKSASSVRPLFIDGSPSSLGRLGRGNPAAPRARLVAAPFDELLEALEIAAGAARDHAQEVAHVLDQSLRLVLELQVNARAPG